MIRPHVHMPNLIEHWKQYSEGTLAVENPIRPRYSLYDQAGAEEVLNIAKKALESLTEATKYLTYGQYKPKTLIFGMGSLTVSIERIATCIINDLTKCAHGLVSNDTIKSIQNDLCDSTTDIVNCFLHTTTDELTPSYVVEQLRSRDLSTSALDALTDGQGLCTLEVLLVALGIEKIELLKRYFKNAKLITVQDLVNLFSSNREEINILKILKNHLSISMERLCAGMDRPTKLAFYEQWNTPIQRYRIYEGKITPCEPSNGQQMDAVDYSKMLTLEAELKTIPPTNEILKYTRLYRGEKGDLFLRIDNYDIFTDSDKALIGEENYRQLILYDNYLWSPDGKNFYQLNDRGYNGTTSEYRVSFETVEGSTQAGIKMNINKVYAHLYATNNQLLGTYERENLAAIQQLFSALKNGEAQLIPLVVTKEPEYLFRMEDGQYIAVEHLKGAHRGDYEVLIGSNGAYQEIQVISFNRYRDGGTTHIGLTNGGFIFSPTPSDPSIGPHYTDPSGTKHRLISLDKQTFDYSSIGIVREPRNSRRTMLEMYS